MKIFFSPIILALLSSTGVAEITTYLRHQQSGTGGVGSSNRRSLNEAFPAYNQQCRDDAGPPFMDDGEIFGATGKYHNNKPAIAVGDCPEPLAEACATKPKIEAFLEGPVNCGSSGWYCRIVEQPGWNPANLLSDLNMAQCNTTQGFNDDGYDKDGHCHGSDSDQTFYWWVRDHWHRGYNGRLRCCCGWDEVLEGGIVNSCDFRRLVLPTEDLNQCRDANEEGVSPYRGGCKSNNRPEMNKPLVEDDAKCWEVQNFGEPGQDEDGDNEEDNNDNSKSQDEDGDNEENDNGNSNSNDSDNDNGEGDSDEVEEQENDNGDASADGDGDNEADSNDNSNSNSNDSGDIENDSDDNDKCKDDPSFLFRNNPNKPCTKMKAKQCGKKQNGKKVSDLCPFTCNTCPDDADEKSEDDGDNNDEEEEEESEESSASADGDDEEEEDDDSCKDDPLFRFRKNGRKTNKTCDKMNSKKCKKKQGGKKIHKYCPMTCGKCGTKN